MNNKRDVPPKSPTADLAGDVALVDREELLQLRETQLDVRHEAEAASTERERLVDQIRDANEQLVLASLQAQQLADDANSARSAADEVAERFRALVLMSSSLVWRATAAGRIELEAESWIRLTGIPLSPHEWGWLEAVHPSDRVRVRATWDDAIAAARAYSCQHRIRSHAGGFAWVLTRAVPIVDAGVVREWVGMMTDISDRIRVEEARDLFIGILGHDLINPLASITVGLHSLRDLPGPAGRTIEGVVSSAGRIQVIVRDLLDFARGRLGGGIPITPRLCDMSVVCNAVIAETKQAHPTRTFVFDGTDSLIGEWDANRLEQLISNLVGNAVAHGLDPIVVTSHVEGDRVVTRVHNRGEPIADALMPTLFEPFTRGSYLSEDGHYAGRSGLGLGLYIAHAIVQAHGGTLSVSSTASDGTTFTVALPRFARRAS